MASNIEKRGDRWTARFRLPPDASGKRPWRRITAATKREVQQELTRIQREIDTGTYIEPSKLSVGMYLQQWLLDSKSTLSAKSHQTYAGLVRTQIVPAIGTLMLEKLTPRHIQTFYSAALENGRKDGKGGLSAQTVKHLHRILSKALKQAVKLNLLIRNPCDAVEPPRVPHDEKPALDVEQAARLLEEVKGTRLYLPILLGAATGMRIGEICALRWEDVDLTAGTLSIRRSQEVTIGNVRLKEPKTRRSRRTLHLPPLVTEALVRHKGEQAQRRLLLGSVYKDQGFIIAKDDGEATRSDSLSHSFTDLMDGLEKTMGLPRITFHGLRHTCVSILIANNVPIPVVSEQIGHCSPHVTLNVYSHNLLGAKAAAAHQIQTSLGGALTRVTSESQAEAV
jgi:integrase